MLRRFKCLVFDKDGTLYCSRNLTRQWTQSILQGFLNIPATPIKKKCIAIQNMHEYIAKNIESETWSALNERAAIEISQTTGENMELAEKRVQSWLPRRNLQVLYPGVKDLISSLPHKKAILTSDDFLATNELLKKDELVFDMIIGGDQVKKGKPDPEGINKILETLQVSAAETCIIGDTKADIDLKKNANLGGAIGIRTLYDDISGADLMVAEVSDLSGYL